MKLTKAQIKEAISLLKWCSEDDKYGEEVGKFLEKIENRPTKRSTTHKERVFYIGTTTFFFRLASEEAGWYYVKATLDSRDAFSRDRGRTVARRLFFQGPTDRTKYFGLKAPQYEDVEKLLNV